MTTPLAPIGRPQDAYPYDRNARAAIRRIGIITAVSGDGKRLTVTVAGGGSIPNVMLTTNVTATIGARVAIVYDRDTALAIGLMK